MWFRRNAQHSKGSVFSKPLGINDKTLGVVEQHGNPDTIAIHGFTSWVRPC